MDEKDRNCVIWPPDLKIESHPCFIHQLEMERIGGDGNYSIKAHVFSNFFLILDCNVEFRVDTKKILDATFHEVRRRGQPVDNGGYYLDPQDLPPMNPVGNIDG